jgi:hypothetical protein
MRNPWINKREDKRSEEERRKRKNKTGFLLNSGL